MLPPPLLQSGSCHGLSVRVACSAHQTLAVPLLTRSAAPCVRAIHLALPLLPYRPMLLCSCRYAWEEWTKRVHPPAPQPVVEPFAPELRPGGKPTKIDLHYKVGVCAGVCVCAGRSDSGSGNAAAAGWLGGWVAGWLGGWVAGWLGGWPVRARWWFARAGCIGMSPPARRPTIV